MVWMENRRRHDGVSIAAPVARGALIALCMLASAACMPPGGTPAAEELPASAGNAWMEDYLFRLVNGYRAELARSPLRYDTLLASVARGHSLRMAARGGDITHEGFQERLDYVRGRRRFSSAAENIAVNAGYDDPAARAFHDFVASPDHRATMIGDFTHTGVGIARARDSSYYFTQIFLTKR